MLVCFIIALVLAAVQAKSEQRQQMAQFGDFV